MHGVSNAQRMHTFGEETHATKLDRFPVQPSRQQNVKIKRKLSTALLGETTSGSITRE